MVKRWLSTSASDWETGEQRDRRANYLAACEEIRQVWDRHIAGPRGPLPGVTLDPFITPRGWCGHVQGLITQTEALSQRKELAATIAEVYQLPPGSVLVDLGWEQIGDTAFIWAYERPGIVDYHERLPHTVFGQEWAGKQAIPGQLTDLERSELKDWARKVRDMIDAMQQQLYPVDMEQVVRRYNRMRAAILDALTRVSVTEVRDLLYEQGLDYHSVGEDIGHLLHMHQHPRR